MVNPSEIYLNERQKHHKELAGLIKKHEIFGWLRLAAIIITAVLAFYFFPSSLLAGWIIIIIGLIAFIVLVSKDTDTRKKIETTELFVKLNEEELKILSGNYLHRYDGLDLLHTDHDYANDLDIFGKASLFQYLNRCNSEQGRALLAKNLLSPIPGKLVLERQQAVKELSSLLEWRQNFQVKTIQTPVTISAEKNVLGWLENEEKHFASPSWKIIVPVYSILSIVAAGAAIAGWLPAGSFGFLFVILLAISSFLSRKALSSYSLLNGMVKQIGAMRFVIQLIEEKKFQSSLLLELQNAGEKRSYKQIAELEEILTRFDLRGNVMVFIFLNSFILWDVRQMLALNKWRKQNKNKAGQWFRMIAEYEVLVSLATLQFNQPEWTWPEIRDEHFHFSALELGHPLIPVEQRVNNDFSMDGQGNVALVTGSNMSGKSTFLRSLGVNTVLALAGGPVCAKTMKLSPVKLMTSMRIADNLNESTSTFYAELKKLKTIIEAIRRGEAVWVLLDEVLRGTNSRDRHLGLEALIRQIIRDNAVAVIATHDLKVSELESELPSRLINYHFDVQVEDGELFFDYKLKEGVCTSLNASILMKKIGIELS